MPGSLPALLRPHNTRLYFAALTLSQLGSSTMLLATGVWIKELTGDNSLAALVQLCVWVPNLFSPLLGAVIDRWPRQRFITAVNGAMCVLLLPLLAVRDAGTVWLVFAVMACYGVSYVLLGAAEPAMITELVSQEELGGLNGFRMSLTEGCKLVAPALGAGLLAWRGADWVVALDSASFVAAALLVSRIRLMQPRGSDNRAEGGSATGFPAAAERGPLLREIREGLAALAADRVVRRLLPAIGAGVFCFNLRQTFVFGILDDLHLPATFTGVLSPVQGAGSVAAGLVAGRLITRHGEQRTAALGMATASCSALLTLVPATGAVLAGSLLWGMGLPWMLVAGSTLLQSRIPARLHGRALATGATVMWGPIAPSTPVGAALLASTGWRLPLAATVAAGAALAVWTAVRARPAGADGAAGDGARGTAGAGRTAGGEPPEDDDAGRPAGGEDRPAAGQ